MATSPTLSADGLFSEINKRVKGVKNVFTKGVREEFPPASRKILAEIGDLGIVSGRVCRKPLAQAIQFLVKKIANQTAKTHDEYFHLSVRFTLSNGQRVLLEKNEELKIDYETEKYSQGRGALTECRPVGLPVSTLTVNRILASTEKAYRSKREFHDYDSIENNCQRFVYLLMKSNNITGDKEFIVQDLKGLLPTWAQRLASFTTGLKARINQLIHGYGFKSVDAPPLSNFEIEDYARDRAIPGWVGVRSHALMKDGAYTPPTRGLSTCVFNLDDRKGGAGTHWVAYRTDSKGRNTHVKYFDSFGMPPPDTLIKYFTDGGINPKHIKYEDDWIQNPKTADCGYWCLWWLRDRPALKSITSIARKRSANAPKGTDIKDLFEAVGGDYATQHGGSLTHDEFELFWTHPRVGAVGKKEWSRRMRAMGGTTKDAEDFYDSKPENQINARKQTQRKDYNAINSHTGEFGHLQADLLDVSTLKSPHNNNVRFLLTVIDIETRYAYATPLTNKFAKTVANAMAPILDQTDDVVKVAQSKQIPLVMVNPRTGKESVSTPRIHKIIETDNGSEFKGAFKQLLKTRGYEHRTNNVESTGQHTAMSIIERFHQTLNNRIRKVVSMSPARKYIDKLPYIIESYNNSKHSTIGTTPMLRVSERYGIERQAEPVKGHPLRNPGEADARGTFVRIPTKKPDVVKSDKFAPTYSTDLYEVKGRDGNNLILQNTKGGRRLKRLIREVQEVSTPPNASTYGTVEESMRLQKINAKERQIQRKNAELLAESGSSKNKILPITEGKRTRKPNPKYF